MKIGRTFIAFILATFLAAPVSAAGPARNALAPMGISMAVPSGYTLESMSAFGAVDLQEPPWGAPASPLPKLPTGPEPLPPVDPEPPSSPPDPPGPLPPCSPKPSLVCALPFCSRLQNGLPWLFS